MRLSRELRIGIVTAVLAVGVPVTAAAVVRARTAALAQHLGTAGGVPARIGGVDADLTGAIRLSDVAFGDLVSADAIEASVALESLLAGELRADELRVEAPRVTIRIDADGDSDLARLARRLAHGGGHGPRSGGARLRRIVVSSGTLTAQIAGVGEISAEAVELVPDPGGVRVTTGMVRVHAGDRAVAVELTFARSAAELAIPAMRFGRVLAVNGRGTVTASDRSTELREISAGRLTPGGALEVQAAVDDGGVPRPFAAELSPKDFTVTLRGEHIPLGGLAALAPRGLVLDGASASGWLRVHKASSLELDLDGMFDGVVLDHRALSSEPMPVAAALRASFTVGPQAITISQLEVDAQAIHGTAKGWLRRGAPASGQLDVELGSAPCADLLGSLPTELRGPLDGLVLDGSLGARGRIVIDLAAPPGEGASITADRVGSCHAVAEPPLADVTALARSSEHRFADGSHRMVGPDQETYVELDHVPSRVSGAFVSAEDGRFWTHPGFDLDQIARSVEINLREGRLARGGSTISQQLIKNAFLTQRRSLDRKLQEAILTWRLEARLTKRQILERYLNIIELGPHVFGIVAAARYWFDERPKDLSTRQAAFLAALTSEPTSMSRRVRHAGMLDPASAERVATILRAMKRDGVLSAELYDTAKQQAMGFAASALRDE